MSQTADERLVHRFYTEGINRHDAVAAAAFYAVGALNHGSPVGREGMRRVFGSLFAAFPDVRFEVVDCTARDDRIVCKTIVTGTHGGQPTLPAMFNGMLQGMPPTGKSIRVLQFHEFRIADGLIVAHDAVRDDLAMLLQLGVVTVPA